MGTTAALSAAGKVLAGARQRKSHQAPPTRVFLLFLTRHATSRVTFCHAKMKAGIKIFEMLIRTVSESNYFFFENLPVSCCDPF